MLTLENVPPVPDDARVVDGKPADEGHTFRVQGDMIWRFDAAGTLVLFVQKLPGMPMFPMWGPWAKSYRTERVSA